MADYNSAYTGQEIDAGIAKANAAVPGSRTVNGKALSADVTLSAADVGARASSWTPDAAEVGADPAGTAETKANAVQTNLTSHTNNKSNPHGVTKAQVGLGNVDNTSDANKPISTATQTALDGKQATVTGGASTITSSNLTASRALVSNGSGKVAVSAVTSTELGYLDGVTSNIQTQINNLKASAGPQKLLEVTTNSTADQVELDLSSIDLSAYNELKVLIHYTGTEMAICAVFFNTETSEKNYLSSGTPSSPKSYFSFDELRPSYYGYHSMEIFRGTFENCVAVKMNRWTSSTGKSLSTGNSEEFGLWCTGTFDEIDKICFTRNHYGGSQPYQPGLRFTVYGVIA